MYDTITDFVRGIVWGWQRNHKMVTITRHAWGHLKRDLRDNLPAREAAVAMRIIKLYERKEMRGV